jgi:hypothetical protein
MSDVSGAATPSTNMPVVVAPTALPLNIASWARGLAALGAGWLVAHGKISATDYAGDAEMAASVLIFAATMAWAHFKNNNAARTLVACMQAAPVTLVQPSFAGVALPPKAASALVMLALSIPLITGCAATQAGFANGSYLSDEGKVEAAWIKLEQAELAWAPTANPATKATVKALMAKVLFCSGSQGGATCTGVLAVLRSAVDAGDQPTVLAQIPAAVALICEANATIKGLAPSSCPAAPASV